MHTCERSCGRAAPAGPIAPAELFTPRRLMSQSSGCRIKFIKCRSAQPVGRPGTEQGASPASHPTTANAQMGVAPFRATVDCGQPCSPPLTIGSLPCRCDARLHGCASVKADVCVCVCVCVCVSLCLSVCLSVSVSVSVPTYVRARVRVLAEERPGPPNEPGAERRPVSHEIIISRRPRHQAR